MISKIEKEIEYWEWMLEQDEKEYEESGHAPFSFGRISATKQFIRRLKNLLRTAQLEEMENGRD